MDLSSRDSVGHLLSFRGEGLVTFNGKGLVNYISPLFLTLTGGQAAELHGLTYSKFSQWLTHRSPLGAPFSGISLLRSRALIDKSRCKEVIGIKNGGTSDTLLEVEWFDGTTQEIAGVLFVRDVSVASSLDQAKQKFIATAAHDLRTPLASISGFTEVLQTQTIDATTQQDFLKIMADQSELLMHMMNAVFDLARMDAQQGKDYAFVLSSVQSLIPEIMAKLALPSGRMPPVVVVPGPPLWVMADRNKLKQAVLQVLANAYQFSPDGGPVKLDISTHSNPDQPDTICLQVTDSGIGMAPEQTLRVFERFYRVSTATTSASAGRGTGMALAKKIIERHHGDLDVFSTLQQGTRVDIKLPLVKQIL